MSLSRDQKCDLLKKNLCFENFFEVMCREGGAVAEIWLEKDREQSMTFEEFRARVMQAAARILDFETAAYYRDKIAELRDGSHGGSAADKTRKKRKGP